MYTMRLRAATRYLGVHFPLHVQCTRTCTLQAGQSGTERIMKCITIRNADRRGRTDRQMDRLAGKSISSTHTSWGRRRIRGRIELH